VTGSVLALNREDDDLGIYNGEYIRIDNSEFKNIGGAIADIYRGGTDESTFGPHFMLRASTIDDVGKNKRNKSKASVRLHGVQATDIHDNVFVVSRPIRVTETVGEPVTRLSGNMFDETAEPEILQIGAGR
jgi:poly(beta-D-mannuronate) lyase